MSDPTVIYDGSYALPAQHGTAVRWWDEETRSVLYDVTYHQTAANWYPGVIGSRAYVFQSGSGRKMSGLYLVEQTPPRDMGVGAIVEWKMTFAVPPRTRKEAEAYVYNFQRIVGGNLVEAPQAKNSTLFYEYYHTEDPDTIPILQAYKIFQAGGVYYATTQVPTAGPIIAEDSTIERWRGNFWARKTRYIPFPVLTVFTP